MSRLCLRSCREALILDCFATFVLALALSPAVRAADIDIKLPIDQVLVYPQSAEISRRGEITIPAGTSRLILHGLPDPIDAGSLRVIAESRNVRLGGIEIEKIVDTQFVSEAERTLRRRYADIQDQKLAQQDDIATAQTQLKLLDAIAAAPADREGRSVIDAASLSPTLATMGTNAAAARAKIRAANIATRSLDDQLAAAKAELDKVVTSRKSTSEVRATVEATAAVTLPIVVVYRVGDAGWQWLYEARLDSQAKRVSIFRQASIRQGSGEDWQGVEVAVTTAKPRQDAGTPEVESLFLTLSDPRMVGTSASDLEEIVVTGSRRMGRSFRAAKEDQPDDAPVITAEEFATDFVSEFRIPGRISIPANRQTRLYPVSEESFEATLVARAVMSVEPAARLEATFDFQKDSPSEAGRVQLYRDGAYVGNAVLPLLLPGTQVRVPFGIDDRIRIAVREERAESGRRGMTGRQMLVEHRRRYEITNFHAMALPIEIIDRVPVPKDSGIRVEILQGATSPTQKDLDGKAGVLLWRLEGAPRKTETIRHLYAVRYPADKELTEAEEAD
ncbi:MAG: mucoidy inhibitor MuiA family protein [Proteobacteria bacterium]|nr:mucoidy inhibitor MuiA family protein [Pseudomonadota bacterium]